MGFIGICISAVWPTAHAAWWPVEIASVMAAKPSPVELGKTTHSFLWVGILAVCCIAVITAAVLVHLRQQKRHLTPSGVQGVDEALAEPGKREDTCGSPAFAIFQGQQLPNGAASETVCNLVSGPHPVSLSIFPHRRVESPIWETDVLLNLILASTDPDGSASEGVPRSAVKWGSGFGSVKGNVRPENQDYCLGFTLEEYQVLLVADGLGGLNYGRRAAFLACWAAATSIAKGLAPRSRRSDLEPQVVATEAMRASSLNLAVEGDKMNVLHEGLRTTLIVIIADKRRIGFAYTGDGGGCIMRQSGEIEHFLKPQKAFPGIMNILAASLGPVPQGDAICGSIVRRPGDLVVVGSDGVFDRLEERPDSFPEGTNRFLRSLRDGALAYDGDLQRVVDQALDEMAAYRDGSGFICDDNMTLGLLGDGIEPMFQTKSELKEK